MSPKYKSNIYKGEKNLLPKNFAWRGIFIKKATTASPPYPQALYLQLQPNSVGKYSEKKKLCCC